jgi:hypothetical protein
MLWVGEREVAKRVGNSKRGPAKGRRIEGGGWVLLYGGYDVALMNQVVIKIELKRKPLLAPNKYSFTDFLKHVDYLIAKWPYTQYQTQKETKREELQKNYITCLCPMVLTTPKIELQKCTTRLAPGGVPSAVISSTGVSSAGISTTGMSSTAVSTAANGSLTAK